MSDTAPIQSAANKAATATKAATKAAKTRIDAAADATIPAAAKMDAASDDLKAKASHKAQELRGEASALAAQAGDKARELADQGKNKAVEAAGSLAKLLEDSAATVDEKLGKQYGDYARTAAGTVAGLADTLDKKELDELAEASREMVRKSPALAVGAAAVIGFMVARLFKGGGRA